MKTGWRLNSGHGDPIVLLTPEEVTIQIRPLPSGSYSVLFAEHNYILQAPDISKSDHGNDQQVLTLTIKGSDVQANILDQSIKAQVLQSSDKSGDKVEVHSHYGNSEFIQPARLTINDSEEENDHGLHAPMNGCLTEVRVQSGDLVKTGDILVIMEAMKMEHNIKAPHDGSIAEIFFNQGDLIDEGREILSFVDETEA